MQSASPEVSKQSIQNLPPSAWRDLCCLVLRLTRSLWQVFTRGKPESRKHSPQNKCLFLAAPASSYICTKVQVGSELGQTDDLIYPGRGWRWLYTASQGPLLGVILQPQTLVLLPMKERDGGLLCSFYTEKIHWSRITSSVDYRFNGTTFKDLKQIVKRFTQLMNMTIHATMNENHGNFFP